ncbi:hypothetical protein JMJ77_0013484, partial [Colletotrichum scovillei]
MCHSAVYAHHHAQHPRS